jgi:LmbE family N-acetylglucosaminyl deacetylase
MHRLALLAVVLFVSGVALRSGAQVRPTYDLGADGLTQALLRLQTTASVLHVGAHPDDEDSAFVARLARGDHARVAFLALSRGEGGQNLIGTELFDALGIIRTEELLQARRLDGGQQFFGRVFDYGFSKTLAEARSKWNEREALADVVRVIRMFRPLVIYARYTGTPTDGHGHHQFAGYITPLAFKAAADPTQFPEHLKEGLRPWQAKKLYQGTGGGGLSVAATGAALQVQTGVFDPVLGRTYREIAIEGRNQHKTQETGTIEPLGPASSALHLNASLVAGRESSLFDGIDTRLTGIAGIAGLPEGALRSELQAIDAASRQAIDGYRPLSTERIVPALLDGLRAVRTARAAAKAVEAPLAAKTEADFLLAIKEEQLNDAVARAASVVVDPLSDVEMVTSGSSIIVAVRTFLGASSPAKVVRSSVTAPVGWQVGVTQAEGSLPAQPAARREVPSHEARYRVTVPDNAPLTQPYYLQQPRQGDMYRWSEGAPKALPFDPPLLRATVTLDIAGTAIDVVRPVEFRYADPVRGELRRDVNVVPLVAVGLDSKLLVVPLGTPASQQRVLVRTRTFSRQPTNGTLRLRLPSGWTSAPAEAAFTLRSVEDRATTPFTVTAPARRTAGSFEIGVEAVVNGTSYTRDVQEIAYPHIQTHRLYWPATLTAQVVDLKVAPVKVGYVMGSGDQVPDALRQMGFSVALIDDETLADGDLSLFDTIVVGIRASEARPAFVANHDRLLQYVTQGGTLIVQYQQGDYVTRKLPPFPVGSSANSRVVDETAPVRILAPEHPVLTFPNRITAADFSGWVQERNLWAFTNFDRRYTALLETADPGEAPQTGGEVYAEIGKGRYVYTAFAWFRQLPAGVPGAFRQFANLVSLSKAPR